MGLRITVKISGDATVQRKLAILGNDLNKLPEAMKNIGKEAAEYYRTTGFSDRGRPWGAGWQDLSVQYKKWKEKHYAGRPTLVRTGDMQDGFFAESNSTSVTIDNSVSYYKYHQSSADRKSNLPRRQMAGVNGKIKDMVRSEIRAAIIKKLDAVR